jgi:hypothetical protein
MLGLGVGDLASHPGQDDRIILGLGQATSPAVGTLRRLSPVLLTAADQFLLRQHAGEPIADLTGQLFQVNQPASGC